MIASTLQSFLLIKCSNYCDIQQQQKMFGLSLMGFLLFITASMVQSAIIGSQIYTLSRQFQYTLNFTSKSQNIIESVIFTPTSDCKKTGFCFYGWITNGTLANKETIGFDNKNNRLQTNNPIFYIQFYNNLSYMVISNQGLPKEEKELVDVTVKLISPTYILLSNLNASTHYSFLPFNNGTWDKQGLTSSQLNKFIAIVTELQTTSDLIGRNTGNSSRDIILHNSGLNCLLGRRIEVGEVQVEIQLVSKSIFEGVKEYADIIDQLKKIKENVEYGVIDERMAFSEDGIRKLFS